MTNHKAQSAKPYTLRMANELKTWVQQRARQNDRSINSELNRIIRQAKEAEEKSQMA